MLVSNRILSLELLELASLLLALESEADLLDLPEDTSTGLSVGNGENVIGRPVGLGSGRKMKRDRYVWWLGIDIINWM